MKHGDMCIGEFVKYKYGEQNGDKICKDNAGTCGRDLCECDLAFAKAHSSVKSVWDTKYHSFWSEEGWDHKDPDNCVCKLFKLSFPKFFKNPKMLKNNLNF